MVDVPASTHHWVRRYALRTREGRAGVERDLLDMLDLAARAGATGWRVTLLCERGDEELQLGMPLPRRPRIRRR